MPNNGVGKNQVRVLTVLGKGKGAACISREKMTPVSLAWPNGRQEQEK